MSGSIIDFFPQTHHLNGKFVRLGLVSRIFSGGTPDKGNLDYWQGGDIPWIGSGEVNQGIVRNPTSYITRQAVTNSSTKLFPKDSLIMALAGQGKTKGTVARMGIDAFGNQSLGCISSYKGESRFLFWWLSSLYREIRNLASQETRDGLNQSMLGQIPVPLFDLATQRRIADFLDRETTRINLLIEKKQRLVASWNERSDAEVSSIVLQTERPESELVETDIDWLGRVPRSWQLSRMGWELQRITYGFTNPMPTEDEGPFLLTANDVNYGRILWESARHTSQHAFDHDLTDKSRPIKGDVLLTKDGTLGRVAIHDGRPACINQSVALLRPRKNRLTSEFLANILFSRRYQDRMVFEAGGTTIKHIYITRLQKMPFPVPTLDEQRAINAQVDATRRRVRLLGDKINTSVDRLKEYRSALITAAVTGQIDVTTYAQSGTTDRHLDAIHEEMGV